MRIKLVLTGCEITLLNIAVSPIAVDKEIPEHDHDHRNCQGQVVSQEFCGYEAYGEKCEFREYVEEERFQKIDDWGADQQTQ